MAIEFKRGWEKDEGDAGLYTLPAENFYDNSPVKKEVLDKSVQYLMDYKAAAIDSAARMVQSEKMGGNLTFVVNYPNAPGMPVDTTLTSRVGEDNSRRCYVSTTFESEVVEKAFKDFEKVFETL